MPAGNVSKGDLTGFEPDEGLLNPFGMGCFWKHESPPFVNLPRHMRPAAGHGERAGRVTLPTFNFEHGVANF
jgi:hypothetical protein